MSSFKVKVDNELISENSIRNIPSSSEWVTLACGKGTNIFEIELDELKMILSAVCSVSMQFMQCIPTLFPQWFSLEFLVVSGILELLHCHSAKLILQWINANMMVGTYTVWLKIAEFDSC